MFYSLKKYANSKQLTGLIHSDSDNEICIIVVDSITEELVEKFNFPVTQANEVLTEIQKIATYFKAFVVDIYGLDLSSTLYNISYLYCFELRNIFKELKIPYYFISHENYHFACLLNAAEVKVEIGETIFLLLTHQFSNKHSFGLTVGEFKFTPKGYQLISSKEMESLNAKEKPESLCQKICGTPNPKNVIASNHGCKKVPLKKIFKPKCLTLISCCLCCFREKLLVETCKWMFDKASVKYYILPTSVRNILIFGDYGTEKNRLEILNVEMYEPLPITKTTTFSKSVPEVHIFFKDTFSREYYFQHHISKDCHKWEITIAIDENNYEEVSIQMLDIDNFGLLLSEMNTRMTSKIPYIVFFGNSSLIGIHKDVDGYEYMDEWNGLYGIDCFISFDQKRPQFGQKAVECLKTKNTCVVFDLLKIMSMPSNNIKISNTWGFTFTSNAENPVLLEFDTFNGTKKAAPPSFLMAMYLRQHLKAIEAKIGEKPKEIGIFITLEFTDDELKRIKDGLKESCRLLKLDSCFIDARNLAFDIVKFGS